MVVALHYLEDLSMMTKSHVCVDLILAVFGVAQLKLKNE
jgi:hypothetical protein